MHTNGHIPIRDGKPVLFQILHGEGAGGERANPFPIRSINGGLHDIPAKAQHVEDIIGTRLFGLGVEERSVPVLKDLVHGRRRPSLRQAKQIEVMHEVTVLLAGKYTAAHVIAFWDGTRGRRGDGTAIRSISMADDLEAARQHLIGEALRY